MKWVKKIKRAYEAEEKYHESLASQFFSNRTEIMLTLKNLNYTVSEYEVLNDVLDDVLNENEQKIVEALRQNPKFKQKELVEKLGISISTVQLEMK